jgi:hypothetical protein
MLLYIGASRYQKARRSISLDGFVGQIQEIVQKQILGTILRLSQWRFPLSENKKEVSSMLMGYKIILYYDYYMFSFFLSYWCRLEELV